MLFLAVRRTCLSRSKVGLNTSNMHTTYRSIYPCWILCRLEETCLWDRKFGPWPAVNDLKGLFQESHIRSSCQRTYDGFRLLPSDLCHSLIHGSPRLLFGSIRALYRLKITIILLHLPTTLITWSELRFASINWSVILQTFRCQMLLYPVSIPRLSIVRHNEVRISPQVIVARKAELKDLRRARRLLPNLCMGGFGICTKFKIQRKPRRNNNRVRTTTSQKVIRRKYVWEMETYQKGSAGDGYRRKDTTVHLEGLLIETD